MGLLPAVLMVRPSGGDQLLKSAPVEASTNLAAVLVTYGKGWGEEARGRRHGESGKKYEVAIYCLTYNFCFSFKTLPQEEPWPQHLDHTPSQYRYHNCFFSGLNTLIDPFPSGVCFTHQRTPTSSLLSHSNSRPPTTTNDIFLPPAGALSMMEYL